jgi:hypothetical protein
MRRWSGTRALSPAAISVIRFPGTTRVQPGLENGANSACMGRASRLPQSPESSRRTPGTARYRRYSPRREEGLFEAPGNPPVAWPRVGSASATRPSSCRDGAARLRRSHPRPAAIRERPMALDIRGPAGKAVRVAEPQIPRPQRGENPPAFQYAAAMGSAQVLGDGAQRASLQGSGRDCVAPSQTAWVRSAGRSTRWILAVAAEPGFASKRVAASLGVRVSPRT